MCSGTYLKMREVMVPDMDKLSEAVEPAAGEAGATVGFCAIGVGNGSQKMPDAEEVRTIEVRRHEAVLQQGMTPRTQLSG